MKLLINLKEDSDEEDTPSEIEEYFKRMWVLDDSDPP